MAATKSSAATDAITVCRAFQVTAREFASRPALRSMDGAIRWSWNDYCRHVGDAAAGLGGLGLGRGDTLACWVSNRPEFHVADTAALHLGAASFSLHPTFTAEQAEAVIRDSGARVLVAEQATLEHALRVRAAGSTALEMIVVVDDGEDASVMSWAELLACAPERFDLDAAIASVQPGDLVTLCYPSQSTGPPTGARITHRNVMAELAAVSERLRLPDGISAMSLQPMSDIAERLCTHYLPIVHGWSVTTCDQPAAIAAVLAETYPEFASSFRRRWETMRAAILAETGGETSAWRSWIRV